MATTRAEAPLVLDALRGAEAPLFHITFRISEFFRSLCEADQPGAAVPT